MHFWIDKRSSYGIGYNRSMSGLSYQHRRVRSKSIVTPVRQHLPPCIPSTSHHAKSHHLHHHRSRHAEQDHRASQSRVTQNVSGSASAIEHHAPVAHPVALNSQYVPVIHSVYPRHDEMTINPGTESNDSSRSNSVTNHWLPIYLKGGICVAMALVLVTLKLYYDNDLSGLQMLAFGLMAVVIVLFTMTVSVLRMKKNRAVLNLRDHNDNFAELVIQPHNNQIVLQSIDEVNEPPPPYALAISFPEKQSAVYESPPPSYEKINII
jgi:hypothetical protein